MVDSYLEKASIHSFTMHLLNTPSKPESELGARDLIIKRNQKNLLVLTEHMFCGAWGRDTTKETK